MERSETMILVTGATGRQGGAVARNLLKDGWKVRALTRSPDMPPARLLKDRGAEIFAGDLMDRHSIEAAMEGIYGVYSVQNTWEHGASAEVEQGKTLADVAAAAGVKQFVYSSVGSAHRHTEIPHFESKRMIEEHIRALGLPATILRPVFFMENFYMPELYDGIHQGVLAMGLRPDKPLQMIAVDDIGVFGAMAFNDPRAWIGAEIELAGDELTGPQMASQFARVLGRDVTYEQTPIEEIRRVSRDYAVMIEWFNARGYEADIPVLRAMHPGLETLEGWLVRQEWAKG